MPNEILRAAAAAFAKTSPRTQSAVKTGLFVALPATVAVAVGSLFGIDPRIAAGVGAGVGLGTARHLSRYPTAAKFDAETAKIVEQEMSRR